MAATGGPSGLQTLTDLELQNLDGSMMARAVDAKRAANAQGINPTAVIDPATAGDLAVTWGDLSQRHADYDAPFWEECRALYASGKRLFGNADVLKRLFPANPYEDGDVYLERVKRAHYFPYAGTILDHLISGLSSDPLRISFAQTDEEGKQSMPDGAEWWVSWIGDVTGEALELATNEDDQDSNEDEGGHSAHEFMLDVVREAMQTKTAWLLCEIPDGSGDSDTETADTAAGTVENADPYFRIVPAEQVIEWEEDSKKNLVYVLTCSEAKRRPTLRGRRRIIEQTYTLWTRTDWVRYVVEFDPANKPNENTVIGPTLTGTHPFERVPFVRFTLPDGLYGMGKLHSLAREHFNKRCAMSWAEYKSLYPILYEFQGAEDQNGMPVAAAQQDPGRGTNQLRAIGYSQIRGKDDRAEFVGPNDGPFKSARESCGDTMREMHRVMFSMALSSNQDSAALMRSGDSKDADYASTEVLLGALGTMIRWCIRKCVAMCAIGKGEAVPPYQVGGLDTFDTQGITDALNEAVLLFSGVPIKSALFSELALARLYAKYMGDDITQEDRETMREQIAETMTAEQLAADAMLAQGDGGDTSDKPAAEPDDDEGGPAPMPAPKKKEPGPMISSKKKP